MKKTIIAMLALAGIAMGDAEKTYWHFDTDNNSHGANVYTGTATGEVGTEDTGITTGDILGNGSTAQLRNAVTFTDGAYITYSNASLGEELLYGSDATLSYTIMAYVNFSNVAGEKHFFGTGLANATQGIALGVKDGKVDFLGKTVKHYDGWDYTLSANTWYHLAFAYDHTDNTVELFVNGVSDGSITLGSSIVGADSHAPTSNIVIGGASTNGAQDDFAGSLAHLEIVTGVAMNAEQVLAAASQPIPEPTTATLSLLALAGLAARRRRK